MILMLMLVFSILPICAMEPGEGEPLLEDSFNPHGVHLEEIIVEGENFPTAIWDNSRRFYDSSSKRKACFKASKKCLTFTALWTGVAIVAGAATGFVGGAIGFPIFKLLDGSRHVIDFVQYTIMPTTAGACLGSLAVHPIATYGVISTIVPVFLHKNPFKSILLKNCLCVRKCNDSLYYLYYEDAHSTLCSEQIDAANDILPFSYEPNNEIRNLLTYAPRLWSIRRKIIPADRALDHVMQRVADRIENGSPLQMEYRKVAFKLIKLLKEKLGKDIVQYLYQFFQNKNILHHLISNDFWRDDYTYLTEKELLIFANYPFETTLRSSLYVHFYYLRKPYINARILAENGWVAFCASEKYPIRCRTLFFDTSALPNEAQYPYSLHDPYSPHKTNPLSAVYLPYHPDLARYYKFEADPYYAAEYEKPSHEKIRKLLILRREILNQQAHSRLTLNNNNNNNE